MQLASLLFIPEVRLKSCNVSSHLKKKPELMAFTHAQCTPAGKETVKTRASRNTALEHLPSISCVPFQQKGVGLVRRYAEGGVGHGRILSH